MFFTCRFPFIMNKLELFLGVTLCVMATLNLVATSMDTDINYDDNQLDGKSSVNANTLWFIDGRCSNFKSSANQLLKALD